MNCYDVNIRVPSQEAKSDLVIISWVPSNVEAAKVGLAEKLVELEAEKEEKIKNSFVVRVCVAPEYHPKIIGRKGAVITKLRDDFKVNIQLPKKEGDSQEEITITGLEENAEGRLQGEHPAAEEGGGQPGGDSQDRRAVREHGQDGGEH